jgi:peptidoglycan/LPS O-acetylase OafA/YrhL
MNAIAIDQSKPVSSSRFFYLDSIRGLAALSVVLSHYVGAYGIPVHEDLWRYSPLHIFFDGQAAVSLFFVLSGFVLSHKYLHPGKNGAIPEIHYAGYVAARICRIWLPMLAVLLISAAVQYGMTPHHNHVIEQSNWVLTFWSVKSDLPHLLKQALFIRQHVNMQLIPQDWTLRHELILSLMMPVAVLLARKHTLWLIGATLYAVIVFHVSPFSLHFMIGAVLAKHHVQMTNVLAPRLIRIAVVIIGLFLYTFRFTIPHYACFHINDTVAYLITGTGAAILLAFVFASPKAQQLLMNPAISGIGTLSYSVYLSHMIILLAVTPHILDMSPFFPWLSGLTATIALTLALSAPLYHYIELPSISAGRKLAAMLGRLP